MIRAYFIFSSIAIVSFFALALACVAFASVSAGPHMAAAALGAIATMALSVLALNWLVAFGLWLPREHRRRVMALVGVATVTVAGLAWLSRWTEVEEDRDARRRYEEEITRLTTLGDEQLLQELSADQIFPFREACSRVAAGTASRALFARAADTAHSGSEGGLVAAAMRSPRAEVKQWLVERPLPLDADVRVSWATALLLGELGGELLRPFVEKGFDVNERGSTQDPVAFVLLSRERPPIEAFEVLRRLGWRSDTRNRHGETLVDRIHDRMSNRYGEEWKTRGDPAEDLRHFRALHAVLAAPEKEPGK